MSEYQERLRELTQDEVVSQLEGADGLLALTNSELFFIGADGVQRAPLNEIKKVVGGKGGTLLVMGESAPLIEAPVCAFQVDELRLFFESVKTYVARQKAATASAAPPSPPPPPEPPAPPPEPAEAPPAPEPPAAETEPVTLEEEDDLPPPITPPEEPVAPAEAYATDEPAAAAPAARKSGVTGLLLKLTSVATFALAAYWIYANPTADPMTLGFVALGGLGVVLVEWHVSNL
ncbi:hypothetical protein [Oceanithermus sp.]